MKLQSVLVPKKKEEKKEKQKKITNLKHSTADALKYHDARIVF